MSLVQTIYCKFIYVILNIYMIVKFFYQVSVKIWLIEKSPHLVMQKKLSHLVCWDLVWKKWLFYFKQINNLFSMLCSSRFQLYICLHLLWVSTHHTMFLTLGLRQKSPSTKSPKHVNLVKSHFCVCLFFVIINEGNLLCLESFVTAGDAIGHLAFISILSR